MSDIPKPQSRTEAYLAGIAGGSSDIPLKPQSRLEAFLDAIFHRIKDNDVVANPTLSGSEANLTGIEVDGTKYKVPSGGGSSSHAYVHTVYVNVSTSGSECHAIVQIITDSAAPITSAATLHALLLAKGFTGGGEYSNSVICSGVFEGEVGAGEDTAIMSVDCFKVETSPYDRFTIEGYTSFYEMTGFKSIAVSSITSVSDNVYQII